MEKYEFSPQEIFSAIEEIECFTPKKFDILFNSNGPISIRLPEFISQKPEGHSDTFSFYWFPKDKEGSELRIGVLQNCISEVKKLI